MKELTLKQRKILEFIVDYFKTKGVPPSFREIAKFFGYKSLRTVYDHIRALEKKGFLIRDTKKSRSVFPSQSINISETLKVYGDIAAGYPILSENAVIDTLTIDADWLKGKNIIAIRVKGDSMIEAHIKDGDYVLIDRDAPLYSGDIVAIVIRNEATLKFYELRDTYLILRPANKDMSDIIVPKDTKRIKIIGKAIAIVRKL